MRPDFFTQQRPRSASLFTEASRWMPGGVSSNRRAFRPFVAPARGQGAHVVDVDGNSLIDYQCGFGAILLGHAHPQVNAAVVDAVKDGVLFGFGATEHEVALAQRLVDLVPAFEQVLFANSGDQASLNAIRVARAYTGVPLILKFEGSFNGANDNVLRNIGGPPELLGKRNPGSAGMLDAAVDATLVARFNHPEDVDALFERHGEQIAAVILEPVLHNAASIMPKPGFLEHLRATCDRWGALLIFDEVITGFRHDLGGWQAISGVTPDLTLVGKALGNGFPIAAFGGRRDVMQLFDTLPDPDSPPPTKPVFYGGTYNGNAVAVAAAHATLDLLTPEVYTHLYALGDRMRDGLRRITSDLDIPAHVSGCGSVSNLSFLTRDEPFASYDDVMPNDSAFQLAFLRGLVEHGVMWLPMANSRAHLTAAHTDHDVDHTLDVAEYVLQALRPKLPTSAQQGRSTHALG